jgi:hypothetical protein
MKRLIFGVSSLLLMSAAIAPAAKAQMMPQNRRTQIYIIDTPETRRVSAFNLVSQAFRGEFSEYGVPSYAVFLSDYRSGQLDAEEVVRSAVAADWLSPWALNDQDYISAVALQMDGLSEAYD